MKHAASLKSIFPDDRIVLDGPDLAFYGRDSLDQFTPSPSAIVFPKTTSEVAALVQKARADKFCLVPSGGRTGLMGGATALNQEVVVNFSKMNKIYDISPLDLSLTAEAGATLQAVKDAAQDKNLFFPIDYAAKGSSQVGGNIATNAGGVRVIQYGSMRDWVLGMTVVTGRGEILNLNGRLHKNRSGYDLHQLIIGSEGTLGIVTEAVLKLTTPPIAATRVLASVDSPEAALEILHDLRVSGFQVGLYEYFDHQSLSLVLTHRKFKSPFQNQANGYLLIECTKRDASTEDKLFELLSEFINAKKLAEVVVANSEQHAEELLSYREFIPQVINEHHAPHKNDLSVPVAALPKFLSELKQLLKKLLPEIQSAVFGHFGDGNIHLNLLKPDSLSTDQFLTRVKSADREIYQLVTQCGGSIAAEHGIGLLKREYLPMTRSKEEIALFRMIKKDFDPDGILNPGKILK